MGMSRRMFLTGFLVFFASPTSLVFPGPRKRRRRRRRRFWRRRTRRRVLWRDIGGRRLLVVPLGIAVGWELMKDDKVVVVKEVHKHTIVVAHADGKTEEIEIAKEDTKENSKNLEGSKYEVEVEEEVE
jgi:hypothetical protein